jgi:endonuclease G, mitochondrial
MRPLKSIPLLSLALAGVLLAACTEESAGLSPTDPDGTQDPGGIDPGGTDQPRAAAATIEGFEAGSKTSYAVGDVTLGSGVWRLDEALIGTSTSDIKVGGRAARVRNAGKLTMGFDRSAGASTVTIRHAAYGADSNGTWALYRSADGGTSWTQVGSQVTTAGHTLATASFTVNVTGTVRFEVRKLDGGTNRINFDDISINDNSGGGGGGGGGTGASISRHTALGLPAPAGTSDIDAYLSVKSGYVLSYNGGSKIPNWVSWELNTTYLGSAARQDDFRPDSTLPGNVPQASLADYSGSGYDRGHMTPSADRTLTVAANSQTFFLTNMIPQAGNNNRGPWANLEEYCRTLVRSGKELFIVSGGTVSAGSNFIGSGVIVPDETFKVIVVLDSATDGAANVTTSTRVISVMMPNDDSQISLGADWRNYRVSVDAIEAQTGDDYLSDVPAAVQAVIEARTDTL